MKIFQLISFILLMCIVTVENSRQYTQSKFIGTTAVPTVASKNFQQHQRKKKFL